MSTPSPINEQDVRQIVRILGEVIAMKPDPNFQRIYLMGELAKLLGADTWVWGVAPLLDPGKQPVYLYHHTGGMDEARMSRFLKAVEHPDSGAMTAPLAQALISVGSQVTRSIEQIVTRERFAASSSINSSAVSPAKQSPPTSVSANKPSTATLKKSSPTSVHGFIFSPRSAPMQPDSEKILNKTPHFGSVRLA